jgi:YD repeat-containing protein
MLQGKRTRRIIAATLLTVMLTNTLAPTVTYALTSGPTAPEATSFEPVDTTDMVNLQSGDFTYNVPLLEVPGPEGGYPLSLSYHAGIQPDQDASWVGLGWTLNPGAITRNVNSYPDDWHDVNQVIRDYWSGGATKTFGVNIGLPLGPANVSFGLSFARDTYKGFGIGGEFGIGVDFGKSGVGLDLSIGTSPFGDMTAGLGLHFGDPNSPVSGSLGISTDFNSVAGYGGINVDGVGMSLATSGSVSVSIKGAGASVGINSNAGRISTESHGFFLPLGPISLNWNYTRYWSDETSNIKTHGALYMYLANEGICCDGTKFDSYDVYHLHDNPIEKNIVEEPDVRKVPGGTFPDNDIYQVSSQGLAGIFKPYAYQEELYIQSVGNSDFNKQIVNNEFFAANQAGRVITANYPAGTSNTPQSLIHFRFTGDFSNSFMQEAPAFSSSNNNTPSPYYNFDNAYHYGNNDGTTGYNTTRNKLAGSKNIDYFSNRQINSFDARSKGFINIDPVNAKGFTRETNDLIGGFSITNETGVTYHYALPAYEYDEVVYSENMPSERGSQGYVWNKVTKTAKYAYTWFLTAITGPDFVDVNSNGYADDSDWGYWVNFEYGKWTDAFCWRNPSEGYHRDLDTRFQNYSKGKKEIYYLNTIKTRTHAAIFEKNIRYDGKGSSTNSANINNHDGSMNYVFDATSRSVLELDKIYLVPRDLLSFVNVGTAASDPSQYPAFHSPSNVCDKFDINPVRTQLANASIKVIDFNYDYSLCAGTSNSYDYTNPIDKKGKLTLKYVQMKGKGAAEIMPPIRFNYELGLNETRYSNITFSNYNSANNTYDIQTAASNIFEPGDILHFNNGGIDDYCTVTQKTSSVNYKVILIRGYNRNYNGITATAVTTKNPFYATDYRDAWGYFKSDFDPQYRLQNENLSRLTSAVSGKGVDAWSLRNINTPLGNSIVVNYQSDTYRKAVLNDYISLVLQQQGSANMTTREITFAATNPMNVPLANYLSIGQDITRNLVAAEYYRSGSLWYNYQAPGPSGNGLHPTHTYYKYTITAINGNNITVKLEIQNYALPYQHFNEPDIFVIANLRLNDTKNFESYGGGLRVRSLELKTNSSERVIRSAYSYSNIYGTTSSGVTAYQPQVFEVYDQGIFQTLNMNPDFLGIEYTRQQAEKYFKRSLYGNISYLLAISRELPPAGVLYEYVTVQNEVQNPEEQNARSIEGKTVYQYEVFNTNMIGVVENSPREEIIGTSGIRYDNHNRNMSIKDFTSRLGLLKRVIKYDNKNRKLSETVNQYLHDDIINKGFDAFADQYETLIGNPQTLNNQGVAQERFATSRVVWLNSIQTYLNVMSMHEEYPVVPTGKLEIDYVNATRVKTENIGFDYYSGILTRSVVTDAYGNRMLTEVIPAWRKYGSLGLKVNDMYSKNMLTQSAGSYVYKVDANNTKLGLVGASVNTWGNTVPVVDANGNNLVQNANNNTQGNVWRMQTTYSWLPNTKTADGITAMGNFTDFNWSAPGSSNANWKLTSDITLYDVYSHALEAKDINANYTAVKMDYGNKKVAISGTAANYNEIAYSGGEDNGVLQSNNQFVKRVDGLVSNGPGVAHTGSYSLGLDGSGRKAFVYTVNTNKLIPGRNYTASVWVKALNPGQVTDVKLYYEINGVVKANSVSSGNSTKTAGEWKLINLNINGADIVSGATLTVGCRNDASSVFAYVDDFRFQPLNATTTAYVYAATGELTHVLDNSNLYTKYEYDAAGRLIKTYREKLGLGEFKTNEYQYNYSASKYGNDPIGENFAKNDCPPNYDPQSLFITIPANQYTSLVSKEEANKMARTAAQDEVNRTAACTPIDNVTINYVNIDGISGYRIHLHRINSGTDYEFDIPTANGSFTPILSGAYDVHIYPPGGAAGDIAFTWNCGLEAVGPEATFSNVIIQAGECTRITLSHL